MNASITDDDLEQLADMCDVVLDLAHPGEYEEEVLAGLRSLRDRTLDARRRHTVPVLTEDDRPALYVIEEQAGEIERCRREEPGATEDPDRVDLTSLLETLAGLLGNGE